MFDYVTLSFDDASLIVYFLHRLSGDDPISDAEKRMLSHLATGLCASMTVASENQVYSRKSPSSDPPSPFPT